jgi:hypothetical protein
VPFTLDSAVGAWAGCSGVIHYRRGAVDAMLYMMDIESHTAIYLSELLVSKACMDPVITSFLSIWAYEEIDDRGHQ